MGLLVLILGLILFLGVHTLTTQRKLRAQVIAATGEGGYKIGYTLLSFAGLVLIIWGFALIARPAGTTSGTRRPSSSTLRWP
jgi:uncharacterized membrane protein